MSGLTPGTRNVAMSALPRANAGRLSKSVVADRALGSRHLALVIWMSYESIPSSMYIFCGFPQGCTIPILVAEVFPHDLVISLSQCLLDHAGPPRPLPFFWVQVDGHLMASPGWAPHVVLQAGPHRAHRARRDTGAIHEATGEALGRRRRRAIRTCEKWGVAYWGNSTNW